MKMKEHRIWWASWRFDNYHIASEMIDNFQVSPPMKEGYPLTAACMAEQLWAEREGMG